MTEVTGLISGIPALTSLTGQLDSRRTLLRFSSVLKVTQCCQLNTHTDLSACVCCHTSWSEQAEDQNKDNRWKLKRRAERLGPRGDWRGSRQPGQRGWWLDKLGEGVVSGSWWIYPLPANVSTASSKQAPWTGWWGEYRQLTLLWQVDCAACKAALRVWQQHRPRYTGALWPWILFHFHFNTFMEL